MIRESGQEHISLLGSIQASCVGWVLVCFIYPLVETSSARWVYVVAVYGVLFSVCIVSSIIPSNSFLSWGVKRPQ